MNSLSPSDEIWPPPVFREVPTTGGQITGVVSTVRWFELVDISAPEPEPLASVRVDVAGTMWWLVNGWALSSPLASRLIADVRVEAMRTGATQVATRPNCAAIIVDAVRADGGRDDGKQVVIDV